MLDLKLAAQFSECDKHLKRIRLAHAKMAAFMPLDAEKFQRLDDDEIEHIDQFLFRFAKLQDAIGERLFVLLLAFLQEEHLKNKPFIDVLNRLEQLGWLADKNVWLVLRKIRNDIAHQYEDQPQQAADGLNAIYLAETHLREIYLGLKSQYLARAQ